jgi:hypothetical protein
MAVRHSSSLREANNGSNPPTMSALHLSCRFAEDRLMMQFRNGRWVFFGDTLSAGAEDLMRTGFHPQVTIKDMLRSKPP